MKNVIIGFLISMTGIAAAANRVTWFDRNEDGAVNYDELSRYCDVPYSTFETADKNHDHVLSDAELRQARRYLLKTCSNLPRDDDK